MRLFSTKEAKSCLWIWQLLYVKWFMFVFQITPIHCAAINPNTKYLAKLLNIVPEYSIMDDRQMRPIHYAAACETSDPLEFLIKRY